MTGHFLAEMGSERKGRERWKMVGNSPRKRLIPAVSWR
jgi:hypothetical protein